MGGLTGRSTGASRVLPAVLAAIVLACGGAPGVVFTPRPPPGGTTPPTASPAATTPATDSPAPTTASPTHAPTTDVSSPPSPTTTAGPADSPLTPTEIFTPLVAFPAEGAFEVTGVAATPSGFVAVGFGGFGGEDYFGRRQGIVWSSADGMTWTQSAPPELQYVTPLGVVSLGSDVFLLGVYSICPYLVDDECADAADAGNAMWRSSGDGIWQRLSVPPQLQLGLIDEVAVGPGRIAVYGGIGADELTTALWLTSDGVNWSETTDVGGLDQITALAIGEASLVVFGTVRIPELESIQLMAAVSADGTQFTPASAPDLIGATIEDVVLGPNGFAGIGYEATDDVSLNAVTVHSADGQTWAQTGSSDDSFDGTALLDVHALPTGYVALGYSPDEEDFTVQRGGAWISGDGQSWRALAPLDETFTYFSASALGQSGLVVFTADQEELDDETLSSSIIGWHAPSEALAP